MMISMHAAISSPAGLPVTLEFCGCATYADGRVDRCASHAPPPPEPGRYLAELRAAQGWEARCGGDASGFRAL